MTGIFSIKAISRSSAARGLFSGILTPNGFFVLLLISFRQREKSFGRIGPAARTPIPPAFETAMMSGAFDDAQLIAAWNIGCSMPSSSVMRVFMQSSFPFLRLDEAARLAGELGKGAVEDLALLLRQAI